jgi:hypothetical protein
VGGALTVGSYYAFELGGNGGASYAAPSATNVSSTAGSATTAPNTSSSDYATGIAAGGGANHAGGNGRIVIHYQ